jgi:tetratricopeptide (TPR) repeat protein
MRAFTHGSCPIRTRDLNFGCSTCFSGIRGFEGPPDGVRIAPVSIDKAKALKAAQKYLARGQLDRAIEEYEKIVEADPNDSRSLLKLGDVYTRQGDPKGAATTYRKVAAQYADQGFFLKAMAVYKQILKLDPSDLGASESLGEVYELLSLASDALSTYEYVAEAHARAGTPEKAIKVLGRLCELDSSNVANWIRYAEMLSKTNRIDEASVAFGRGADLLMSQGRIDDYIKVTERLLFHSHDDIARARDLAQIYVERNQGKAALPHLQTCFKAEPKDSATLQLLARAFQDLGQTTKAASVYKELARIHADAGKVADEHAVLARLSDLEPDNTEISRRLAVLAQSPELRAKDDEALEMVELDDAELIDDRPTSEAPAAFQGEAERSALLKRLMSECEVFVRYGLRDKIVTQLQRVLELDPNHVEAREKLRDTYIQRGEVDAAVQQLLLLSDTVAQSDPSLSVRYLEQASALRPNNETVAVRLRLSRPPVRPGSQDLDHDQDQVVLVDDDIVDESDFSDLASEPPTAIRPNELLGASAADLDVEPELLFEAGAEDEEEPIADREQEQERAAVTSVPSPEPAPHLQAAPHAEPVETEEQEIPAAIEDALEEAEFYLSQKLYDEAREILNEARAAHGDHPRLLAVLRDIESDAIADETPAVPSVDREAVVTKLAQDAASTGSGPIDVASVLKQFKEGLRDKVEATDTATHHDLGIAYMEMGLHAEAIEEFKLCLGAADKQCTAHTMIGLSYVAKGEMQNGITHFKQALANPLHSPDEEQNLWFEIGNAYELLEQAPEALGWYRKVQDRNPRFRNVEARIARVGSTRNEQQEVDEFDAMFDNMIMKD